MSDYISREAAIADLELYEKQVVKNEYALAIAGCRSHIRNLPAVDVRPVVTCADCKHWVRIKKDCILASCDLDALVRCEDFYCANGEKREES